MVPVAQRLTSVVYTETGTSVFSHWVKVALRATSICLSVCHQIHVMDDISHHQLPVPPYILVHPFHDHALWPVQHQALLQLFYSSLNHTGSQLITYTHSTCMLLQLYLKHRFTARPCPIQHFANPEKFLYHIKLSCTNIRRCLSSR